MFFVFSRDKIITYCISVSMIMLLLGIAFQTKKNGIAKSAASNKIESNIEAYKAKNKWIFFLL